MSTKSKLQPVNLIISEQDLLRTEAIVRLRDRMVEEGTDLDLDSQSIEADNIDPSVFAEATGTLPFMSPQRLVIINNIDKLRAADPVVTAIIKYCNNPNPTTILALTAHRLAKTTKLYKAIAKAGLVIDRKAPAKRDMPEHVRLMFAAAGLQVQISDATTLINLVGDDLLSLNSAISQLAAFKDVAGKRKPDDKSLIAVNQREITNLIGETTEVKAWELTDALANRDGVLTLDILNRLIRAEGESVHFLAVFMTVTKVRELLTARALIDRGSDSAQALIDQLQNHSTSGKGRSLQPWLADRILRQARSFSTEQLREALRELAAVEHTMKTSPPQLGRLALVRCLLQLTS